jgi:superfamily II DNA or RNA helicase
VDVSGVGRVGDDYNEGQLSAASRNRELLANTVSNWIELGENRPTIAFCVDRAHARDMQERFLECNISCEYLDGKTPADERAEIAKRSELGVTKVVVSIGCLTEGVDWPWISCILHARRTLSHMLWIQSVGRGLRLSPGKTDCILLDCAGNFRLGHPYSVQFDKLHDGTRHATEARKVEEKKIGEAHKCKSCGAVLEPGSKACSVCGAERATKQTDVEEGEAELVEIDQSGNAIKTAKKGRRKPEDYDDFERQQFYSGLLTIGAQRKYKRGWAANMYKEKFKDCPNKHGLSDSPLDEPHPETLSWVRARLIRWAKRKKKQEAAK